MFWKFEQMYNNIVFVSYSQICSDHFTLYGVRNRVGNWFSYPAVARVTSCAHVFDRYQL